MQRQTLQKVRSIGRFDGARRFSSGARNFEHSPRCVCPGQHDCPGITIPAYDPYPPGILPSDLNSEIARIQREMTGIFNEALGEWKALPPLTYTGNPPILQYNGYNAVEILGKLMNFDLDISPYKNVGCAFCHMPYAAFSGPIPSVNLTMVAYPASYHYRAAKRTAQRYTYSHRFPRDGIQHNAGGVLWRNLLGRARDRLQTAKSLTPSRHSIRRSIPWKWPSRIRLASRFGYPRRCTGPSLSRSGARISTSVGPPPPRRPATPRQARRCSALAPPQLG